MGTHPIFESDFYCLTEKMLNVRRELRRIKRTYIDDIVIKNGGFRDPWFEGKFSGDQNQYKTKEIEHFPTFNQFTTRVNRPMENPVYTPRMKWDGTPKTSPVTHVYDPEYHGWSPKPTWLLTQFSSGQRVGSYKGAKAKVVWKPPGKGQRQVMVKSYEPEEPPMEFMEMYTDINNQYKDEISALRIFMFRRYVEPTIVEDEAFAQFQVIIESEENHYIVNELKGDEQREKLREIIANYQLPPAPVRHHRFRTWYREEEHENGLGCGQHLVKQAMLSLVEIVSDMRMFDCADVYDMNSQ